MKTPDELRQQARNIYSAPGNTMDKTVTDLIFALVMAQADILERLDALSECHEKEDFKDVQD